MTTKCWKPIGGSSRLISHPRWDFFAPVNSTGCGVPPPPVHRSPTIAVSVFFKSNARTCRYASTSVTGWLVTCCAKVRGHSGRKQRNTSPAPMHTTVEARATVGFCCMQQHMKSQIPPALHKFRPIFWRCRMSPFVSRYPARIRVSIPATQCLSSCRNESVSAAVELSLIIERIGSANYNDRTFRNLISALSFDALRTSRRKIYKHYNVFL